MRELPSRHPDALLEEIERLKAEVERLTAFTTRTIIPNEELQAQVERVGAENANLHKGIYSLSLNVAQLKDEVERLTKAVMHSPAAQLKLKELEGKTTYEEINPD